MQFQQGILKFCEIYLTNKLYSPPPPPMARILRVQLEEPHTVMGMASVVEVSIVELWRTPSISKTQERPVASSKHKIIGTISQKMYNGHKQTLVGIDNRQQPQSTTEQCPIVVLL